MGKRRTKSTSNADLNQNGVPDVLEKKDLNNNGIPDSLERGFKNDLNGNGIPDSFETGKMDLNGNGIPDSLERGSLNDLNGNGIPDSVERLDLNGNGIPDSMERTTLITQVMLPTQVIEKPAAIHEEIRREQVEEIQPVINVEKIFTEVHQIKQPLVDREVKPVGITEVSLPTQVLPQITQPTVALRAPEDISTVSYKDSEKLVVEKTPMILETQKTQIIEEIQPVLYKETIVPILIKETRPIFQTIVEGTTYVHQILPRISLKGSRWEGKIATSDLSSPGVSEFLQAEFLAKDLNRNGIPDSLERSSNDLNGNGIPDSLERRSLNDLNGNGIPDSLERRSTSDLNGNGIPDKYETTTRTTTQFNAPYAPVQTM